MRLTVNVTKQQLESLYNGQGLTVRQCANALGLPTHGGISWRLKKYGIAARQSGVPVGYKRGEFTQAHRDNLSKSHTGNMGYWTGKKRSSEDIEKFRKSHLGKVQSDETKRKRVESISGENHYNWMGGISAAPYAPIWIDKRFKAGIRERDSFTCQNPECRKNDDRLTIHHVDYCKKNCNPKNLITLCNSCNARANFNREFWQAGYAEIIRLKYAEIGSVVNG